MKAYQERYGQLDTPVLAGVLPLVSSRHAVFLNNEVPGIRITEEMQGRLQGAGDAAAQEGVSIALELVEEMKPWASGIYLMPQFNRGVYPDLYRPGLHHVKGLHDPLRLGLPALAGIGDWCDHSHAPDG